MGADEAPALASLLQAIALALAGGLVLNLMPCVLPVLSVKALGLVKHSSGRPSLLRAHGLAYAAGVLVSFAVVAGALIALRAGGEQLGWGFQLQSPAFVILLAWLFSLLYVGSIRVWWADWSPPSRYLLAGIAFPLLAVAATAEMPSRRSFRALASIAAAWTALVTAALAVAPGLRFDLAIDVRPTGGPGALWTAVRDATGVDPAVLFPSVVRAGPGDVALAVAWILLLAALVTFGARRRAVAAP